MNNFVDTVKIELKKKTPEELSEKICELVTDNIIKDKEIERLNNIIDELEKYILNHYIVGHTIQNASLDAIINKLKELKEGKIDVKK